MAPRRLNPREMDDLCDTMEERVLEKIRAELKSELVLMKSDMIAEIVSALGGVPRHVGTENGYGEANEDFETNRSSGRVEQDERPSRNRVVQLDRSGPQLKLKRKMEVSNFSGTLNPEDLIDWIGE